MPLATSGLGTQNLHSTLFKNKANTPARRHDRKLSASPVNTALARVRTARKRTHTFSQPLTRTYRVRKPRAPRKDAPFGGTRCAPLLRRSLSLSLEGATWAVFLEFLSEAPLPAERPVQSRSFGALDGVHKILRFFCVYEGRGEGGRERSGFPHAEAFF